MVTRSFSLPSRWTSEGLIAWWEHLALLAGSAVLLLLAFPRPGWWPLAYVALVPMGVAAVRSRRPWRLTACTYAVFVLWWLVMLRWLIPVTGGGYTLLCLWLALYPAAAAGLMHLLHRRLDSAMTVAMPLVWVTMELLRSHLLEGGFGWFCLGHSQAAWLSEQGPGWIVQSADLFGELTVSFVVVMTSGLIVDLLTRPLFARRPERRWPLRRTMTAAIGLWVGVFGGALFYGHYRLQQSADVTTPGPRLAVVQTNVPQSNKNFRTPEQDAADWQAMLRQTVRAADQKPKPDLIVWPETMVPGGLNAQALDYYAKQPRGWADGLYYHQQIETLTEALDVPIVVGSHAYYDWQTVTARSGRTLTLPTRRFNSVFLYDAQGRQQPERYDKIHLVPFGEYIPWVSRWPWLKGLFIRYISPYPFDYSLGVGERETVFALPADGAEVSPFVTPICFEDAISRVTRRLIYTPDGQKRAQMIVNVTNSAWYPQSDQQAQHLQIAVFRSIENRVPTARSVNYGVSGFIDSSGRVGPVVQQQGKRTSVAGVATATMQLDSRRTVYGLLGELPMTVLALVTLGLILGATLRRDKISRRAGR